MAKQFVIPRQQRSGESFSATLNVPKNARGTVTCLLDMGPPDSENPQKEVHLILYKFHPEDTQFHFDAGIHYIGGVYFQRDQVTRQTDFGFIVNVEEYQDNTVQVVLSIPPPKTMIVGATFELVMNLK